MNLKEIERSIRAYILVECNFNDMYLDEITNDCIKVLLEFGTLSLDQVDTIIKSHVPPADNVLYRVTDFKIN